METTHLPEDIIKAYEARILGCYKDNALVLKKVALSDTHEGLICVARIPFTTKRAASFLPFSGHVDIVYDPGKYLIGFGEILSFVRTRSEKFQHQEKFAQELAKSFMHEGGAKGVLVCTRAQHISSGSAYPVMATSVRIGTLSESEKFAAASALITHAYD